MKAIAEALSDPATRQAYMIFCFALMVLPMIALAVWYHTRINRTAGGRALMERQNKSDVTPLPYRAGRAAGLFQEAGSMASGIAAGKYGANAKSMQTIVYWVCGLWVIANAVAFGILLWADEINRAAG